MTGRTGLAEAVDFQADGLTEADVVAWGRRIGEAAVAGEALPLVLALRGALGAGKSVLARAVARGAGVTSPMPSPTFNLVFRYEGGGGVELYHVDLYRLNHEDEVWELGWREFGSGRQIVLIEWPERAEVLLPGDRWDIGLAPALHRGVAAAAAELRWVWGVRCGEAAHIPEPGA